MNDYLKIDVTPNVKKCMEILAAAVQMLADGPVKDKAEGALKYLDMTFAGEPQPYGGDHCPPEKMIVGSG